MIEMLTASLEFITNLKALRFSKFSNQSNLVGGCSDAEHNVFRTVRVPQLEVF